MTTTVQPRVHARADIEADVTIGAGTAIWSDVHIRAGARIGADCIIGEKTVIGPGVIIGDRVKINALVYIPTGVTIEDGVMLSAGTVFTNDRYPRATTPDLSRLLDSSPNDETLPTTVRSGATVGAGAVIGCGIEIGRFAMVGMGAVVTRSVGEFTIVHGVPARFDGIVCRCGARISRRFTGVLIDEARLECNRCGRAYIVRGRQVQEDNR